MADNQQEVVEEVEDAEQELETEEQESPEKKAEQKPARTQGPNSKEQTERLKRQASDAKAERDKAIKERDEALARAGTAEDIQKLKEQWHVETLQMEILQEQGIPLGARKKLTGTTREAIESEIKEQRSWFGVNGKSDPQPSEDEDTGEQKKESIIRRPTPKKDPPAKPVSEMTPEERQDYYSKKMEEEFSPTKK